MIAPKFRAWNASVKRMTYFGLPPVITGDWEDKMGMFFKASDDVFLSSYSDPMQFTGLHDKNGKDIYEGDVVENGLSGTWVVQPLEQGAFSLLGVCQKYRDCNYLISALNSECEVIGNIHENPEMLEVEP